MAPAARSLAAFLDNVDTLPLVSQAALLRVLEVGEVRVVPQPVGAFVDLLWSDLRKGTIITVAEELADDVSFDPENDEDLHDLLLEQSRRQGSGFEISARSEAATMTDRWDEKVRRQISEVDEVIAATGFLIEGWRIAQTACLPSRVRARERPIVWTVLPSPAGVGLIAVTSTSFPSGRSRNAGICRGITFSR